MPRAKKTTESEVAQGSTDWDIKEKKETTRKSFDEGDYGLDEKDYTAELELNSLSD